MRRWKGGRSREYWPHVRVGGCRLRLCGRVLLGARLGRVGSAGAMTWIDNLPPSAKRWIWIWAGVIAVFALSGWLNPV